MEEFKILMVIILSSVFVYNYVLCRFLGICPFLGVSKKLDQATGMGIAVTFVMLMVSIVFGIWALIDKIIGRALEGMTTVIIITIFIGSIIMISLGIIGYYIARIYEEIKGRPKYIISSSVKSVKE